MISASWEALKFQRCLGNRFQGRNGQLSIINEARRCGSLVVCLGLIFRTENKKEKHLTCAHTIVPGFLECYSSLELVIFISEKHLKTK